MGGAKIEYSNLIVGGTGTGKSVIFQALKGGPEEANFMNEETAGGKSSTMNVTESSFRITDDAVNQVYDISMWDTPGFDAFDMDAVQLFRDLVRNIILRKEIHHVLFVFKFNRYSMTTFTSIAQTLNLLEVLGAGIEHAHIVITHSLQYRAAIVEEYINDLEAMLNQEGLLVKPSNIHAVNIANVNEMRPEFSSLYKSHFKKEWEKLFNICTEPVIPFSPLSKVIDDEMIKKIIEKGVLNANKKGERHFKFSRENNYRNLNKNNKNKNKNNQKEKNNKESSKKAGAKMNYKDPKEL